MNAALTSSKEGTATTWEETTHNSCEKSEACTYENAALAMDEIVRKRQKERKRQRKGMREKEREKDMCECNEHGKRGAGSLGSILLNHHLGFPRARTFGVVQQRGFAQLTHQLIHAHGHARAKKHKELGRQKKPLPKGGTKDIGKLSWTNDSLALA